MIERNILTLRETYVALHAHIHAHAHTIRNGKYYERVGQTQLKLIRKAPHLNRDNKAGKSGVKRVGCMLDPRVIPCPPPTPNTTPPVLPLANLDGLRV